MTSYNSSLIELHVPDFEKIKDFYGKLGFEVVWERKPEKKKGYLVLRGGKTYSAFGREMNLYSNNPTLNSFRKIQSVGTVLK